MGAGSGVRFVSRFIFPALESDLHRDRSNGIGRDSGGVMSSSPKIEPLLG